MKVGSAPSQQEGLENIGYCNFHEGAGRLLLSIGALPMPDRSAPKVDLEAAAGASQRSPEEAQDVCQRVKVD